MDPLVSIILMTLFILVGIGLVITISNPVIEKAKSASSIQEAEVIMKQLYNHVISVENEGNGSSRKMSLDSRGGEYQISKEENSILYEISGPSVFEYLSRKYNDGFFSISGNDVDCYESGDDIVIENSRISAIFQKVGNYFFWDTLDTATNIKNITQNDLGIGVSFSDSSILIDDNPSSSYGNGYSEILKDGTGLPVCIAHFMVNASSGDVYDVYYMLFAGADFIVQEIGGLPYSKTITSNFATHINTTDLIRINGTNISSDGSTEETYVPSKRFISSNSNGTVFATVFAGSLFNNISLNTSYSGDDYLFQMRQGAENNRILIAYTNGSWEQIDSRMLEIDSDRLIGTTFGNFTETEPDEVQTTFFTFFKDINITLSDRIGMGNFDVIIKNLGKINNITNVEIDVT